MNEYLLLFLRALLGTFCFALMLLPGIIGSILDLPEWYAVFFLLSIPSAFTLFTYLMDKLDNYE